MYPLEMDYGQDAENIKKLDLTKSKSKLDKKVQELITTIFDIESMKKAMIEFEIDMTKMPMGKHHLGFLKKFSASIMYIFVKICIMRTTLFKTCFEDRDMSPQNSLTKIIVCLLDM